MNFVEAQAQYYAQCHAYMQDLQKQLARYNIFCCIILFDLHVQ